MEEDRGQSPLVKKCLGNPSRSRTEDGITEDWYPIKPESWRTPGLHRPVEEHSSLWVSSFSVSVFESSSASVKSLHWSGMSTILTSIRSVGSDGVRRTAVTGCTTHASWSGVVGVLLGNPFSFCTNLGLLLLGEREDREGLSGRGLGMSMWSRGRALPVSLAWRLLEKELSLEPALSVGETAAWGVHGPGNGDVDVLGDETMATGVVGLLRVKSRRGSDDPGSSGSTTFRLSPMDTERDILAMELVVGLM